MSRSTRRACLAPLPGGMNRSTSSLMANSPTRSLFATALNAMRAATSAATARLVCRCVPNRWLPLTSTAKRTVNSRSSTNRLMNGDPIRAVTFQSIDRTSSPGWYSRTSSNDSPVPLKTEWYSPPSSVWTARRARSCKRRICRITSAGSTAILLGKVLVRPQVSDYLDANVVGRDRVGKIARHLRVAQRPGPRRRPHDFDRYGPLAVPGERLDVLRDQVTAAGFAFSQHDRLRGIHLPALDVVDLHVENQVHVECGTDVPPRACQPGPLPGSFLPTDIHNLGLGRRGRLDSDPTGRLTGWRRP